MTLRQLASNALSLLILYVSSMSVHISIPHICAICLHEKERQRAVAFRVIADMLASQSYPQRDELTAVAFIKK